MEVLENETVDETVVVDCSEVVEKTVVEETTSLTGNPVVELSETPPDMVVGKTGVVVKDSGVCSSVTVVSNDVVSGRLVGLEVSSKVEGKVPTVVDTINGCSVVVDVEEVTSLENSSVVGISETCPDIVVDNTDVVVEDS